MGNVSDKSCKENQIALFLCSVIFFLINRAVYEITVFYYYRYSALGPVWAETRAQSGNWYGSCTLHPGQVLRGSLPLLYSVEPGRSHMTIRRMRISRQVPKATNTYCEYVILIVFHCHNGCTNVHCMYC